MSKSVAEEIIKKLEEAFNDLADLAGENLPDYYDDDEGEAYVVECNDRYDADIKLFKTTIDELKKNEPKENDGIWKFVANATRQSTMRTTATT